MPHYITRLAYNSADWRRPTADARAQESGKTYNKVNGFGHEDWIFRNEWSIDGWRYGFAQGVGRSFEKLVKADEPFDLTFFTIPEKGSRRYVATIRDVEVLKNEQADEALDEFQRQGWLSTMADEIRAVGGNAAALGDARWARHILNLRFRWEKVVWADPKDCVSQDDPVRKLQRYYLVDAGPIAEKYVKNWHRRTGTTEPPPFVPYFRRAVGQVYCSPEHARMQAELMKQLREEFPGSEVIAEEGFIDVCVKTDTEHLLFELKSDLDPRSVIRQALGQLLEYAYHPSRDHALPLRLFIVGRRALAPAESAYLEVLKSRFSIPIDYRQVSI